MRVLLNTYRFYIFAKKIKYGLLKTLIINRLSLQQNKVLIDFANSS